MKRTVLLVVLTCLSNPISPAFATEQGGGGAPYLEVLEKGGEQSVECLPLKGSRAEVEVAGTIARVRLEQRYANTGTVPIEARYVFPCSTRAAVHGMKLTSGGRVIATRIRESAKARAEFETAKRERKIAALLEERRSNVLDMTVANLPPGEEVRVEVEWTETVTAVDGVYEFVLPVVVGPRYTGGKGGAGDATGWAANPHLGEGRANPAALDVRVDLATGLPLSEVTCPGYPGVVDFKGKDHAVVRLDGEAGRVAANRDFILRWKLGGGKVAAGLLLHRDGDGGHFLLQMEPPARVDPDLIPPRDYVMVVDVSGSMSGFPLETAKTLLRELVAGLKPTDTFNVLYFASGSEVFSDSPVPASGERLAEAVSFMERQRAGGGTELQAALERSLALPGSGGRSRTVLLVTDGFVTAESGVRELVASRIGEANLFAFGIGSSVNRELVESVARAGGGEPEVVTDPAGAPEAAKRVLKAISSPVLAKVRVEAEGFRMLGVIPSRCPDVFASRPLALHGAWSGEPTGTIVVRGIAGNGEAFEQRIDVAEAAARGTVHPALPVLWARERVRELGDILPATADSVRETTTLGLAHSLLTPYTSFVAVDETPRNLAQEAVAVRQPLPLPAGVTAAAVGMKPGTGLVRNGSVPEPGSAGLVTLLVVTLILQRRRPLKTGVFASPESDNQI